jgi:hypothetical protein
MWNWFCRKQATFYRNAAYVAYRDGDFAGALRFNRAQVKWNGRVR